MSGEMGEIFTTLVGLFAIIGVGYFTVKLKVVSKEANRHLTTLLMKIALPCTVFMSMQREFDADFLKDSGIVLAIAAVSLLIAMVVSSFSAKALHIGIGNHGAWIVSCVFSNSGFMGFPVVLALFGEEGMALAVMFNSVTSVYMYTLGINIICKDSKSSDMADISLLKIIFSPINIAMMLGIVFYVTQISLPDMIASPIKYLGNMTTPMSMFIVGISLAQTSIKSIFKDVEVLSAMAMRLIVLPLLVWLVLSVLPIDNQKIVGVVVIIFALPTAAVTSALTGQYGGNQDLAAKITFITSLVCIATIPLWAMLV